jgi:ankyrin repeat protein
MEGQPERDIMSIMDIFKMAVEAELPNVVKAVIAEPNFNGGEALNWAGENGNTELAKVLIKAGANLNWQNKYGNTALILAVLGGNTELIKALIGAGPFSTCRKTPAVPR